MRQLVRIKFGLPGCTYLAGILTPVRATSTEHVPGDLAPVIVLILTDAMRHKEDFGLSQVLGFVPQAWRENHRRLKLHTRYILYRYTVCVMWKLLISVSG